MSSGSYMNPNCGTAEFPYVQINYTWTDSVGRPGSGWDVFHVKFMAPPQFNQTLDEDIYVVEGFPGKLVGARGCSCNSGDAAGTTTSTGAASAGEPIDIGSGNVSYEVTDYTTAGQNPLTYIRSYNSGADITGFALNVGASNWRSNYDRYIDILSSSVVVAERANGQFVPFFQSSGSWAPDSDVDLKLVQSGNTWTLTDENDTVETYTARILPIANITFTNPDAAQLNSIKFRNGYTQNLSYNGSNQLVSVSDSYGRTLAFSYNSGLLQTLTTPDKTTISYNYGSVVLPPIAAGLKIVLNNNNLTSVVYPTSPTSTQTYLYENASLPFALTGVIDGNGNRFASWTHDSSGRGLTSQLGSGASLTTIVYDDKTGNRTVTNALGQQEIFQFTTLQGIPKISEIDRQATATTTAAKLLITYDANGYLTSRTDWTGNKTNYTNNAHGLPTTIIGAAGSSVARTTAIAYDSKWVHLPATIVTPGLNTGFTYDANGNVLTRVQTDTTTATAPYKTGGQTRTVTNTWSNFLLASVKTPKGNTTSFTYDSTGALTAVTNALAQVTQITQHTGGGLPQIVIDPNVVTTILGYDARQRPLVEL